MRSTQELYRLQAIDLDVDRVRQSMEGSEGGVRAREAQERVQALRQALEEVAQRLRDLSRQVRRLELDAQTAREEQRRAEEELYAGTTTSGKELGHLQQRSERAARQAEALEAEGLARMEEAEVLEARQKQLEAELRAAEEESLRLRTERQLELDDLAARREELETERVQVLARVPDELRERYERMRRRLPNPVAGVAGGRCGACHVTLSQRTIERLRVDQALIQCEQCGRILHLL